MLPTIATGNVASAIGGGYDVANSCRFNDDDTAYMAKTMSAGDTQKYTFSTWVKRGNLGGYQGLLNCRISEATRGHVYFQPDNKFAIYLKQSGEGFYINTNAVYRDSSAWYHVCVGVDSTQSTEANRVKIYVNGTQVTSFENESYPDLNENSATFNVNTQSLEVGRMIYGDPTILYNYIDGYMAETVFIDGTQYAASDFGEFDSDSPTIWKPKDVSGLTFGTNGFYLDFEDSANLGNDANGGTDLTETNLAATDQASDSPTNNFATINILTPVTATISEGNLKFANTATDHKGVVGTFGASSGKWYCEIKTTDVSDSTHVGIIDIDQQSDTPGNTTGYSSRGYSLSHERDVYNNNGIISGYTDWTGIYGDGDILGIAMDLDNDKLYFSKGGQWSAGDGTWGSTTFNSSTGAIPITAGYTYTFGASVYNGNSEFNFGSPPFSISSGNADGNSIGNFEYSVPSGYYALCTANLAEFG